MNTDQSPLFAEYLDLCSRAGWDDLIITYPMPITSEDVLIVVDMQNDFVPCDDVNPVGGAFGVAEGGHIVGSIVQLMEHFAASGAMVIATRDYHPYDHCSFHPVGPFPRHCVQGSVGSKFYKDIGECLHELWALKRRAEVVFKGFHEDVDSFGSFEYKEEDLGSRVTCVKESNRLHGCTLNAWTGSVALKCSNQDEDVDAPPDVLSVLSRETLKQLLNKVGTKRVFACGLALDFCVLDTVLNATAAGFEEVYVVLDATRAAHIRGIGQVGSGFLSDPVELKTKMLAHGVKVVPTTALVLPTVQGPSRALQYQEAVGDMFPRALGPFALVPAIGLELTIDSTKERYVATGPQREIVSLAYHSLKPEGLTSPVTKITLSDKTKNALEIPAAATHFVWAFPVPSAGFTDQAWGYFAITTPSAAFFALGGFVYLNDAGGIEAVRALSVGGGLTFQPPAKWRGSGYSQALASRWHKVTAPYMKEKGVKLFTWVNPSEVITPVGGGVPWEVCKHGAFAYLFNEDLTVEDGRNTFFEVSPEATKPQALGHVKASQFRELVKKKASAVAGQLGLNQREDMWAQARRGWFC